MANNRIIYQSEGVFFSNDADATGSGEHEELRRVQSANYSFTINRNDIFQYGDLARIDSLVLEPPTVSLDLTYYVTDGWNERIMGFSVGTGGTASTYDTDPYDVNFASGALQTGNGRNIYIVTCQEGQDLHGDVSSVGKPDYIGIGNAYLSDYTLDVAVGDIPTVSVTWEGANMMSKTGLQEAPGDDGVWSGKAGTAAINQTNGAVLNGHDIFLKASGTQTGSVLGLNKITALRPGDVTLNISGFGGNYVGTKTGGAPVDISGAGSIHLQSASLSLPLSRSPLERLGTKFPFARSVDFPVSATLTCNGLVSEGAVSNLTKLLDTSSKPNVTLAIKSTNFQTAGNERDAIKWTLKRCTLDSVAVSSSIGSNKSVDLTFTTSIGGPNDSSNGIFCNGTNTGEFDAEWS